jgi:hypothetical protein
MLVDVSEERRGALTRSGQACRNRAGAGVPGQDHGPCSRHLDNEGDASEYGVSADRHGETPTGRDSGKVERCVNPAEQAWWVLVPWTVLFGAAAIATVAASSIVVWDQRLTPDSDTNPAICEAIRFDRLGQLA